MNIQLPPELFHWLTTVGGVAVSGTAALAAAFKFHAWWRDRRTQARLESAAYFVKEATEPWQKPFGERQLVRQHFARLTGINREDGHEAILRCHARLGGTDGDWEALRRVGGYLQINGDVAHVRDLHRRDHVGTGAIVLGGLLTTAVAVALLTVMVNLSAKANWNSISLETLFVLVIAGVYACMFALFGWVAWIQLDRYSAARGLRRRLAALSAAAEPVHAANEVASEMEGG